MYNQQKITSKIEEITKETVDDKKVFGLTLAVESSDNSFCYNGSGGIFKNDTQYFIASATKLFLTAITLNLKEQECIDLDYPISNYLPENVMNGLHIFKGIDYSEKITVKHLMSNTSGLPDYFQQKQKNGKSIIDEIKEGKDLSWTFEDAINFSKQMQPEFAPGTKGKAHYSDTNAQLLGKILEIICEQNLADIIQDYVCAPLKITNTYLYQDINDTKPTPLYFEAKSINMPKAMKSFGADGGIVSTASDMMAFLKAFFKGDLFPKKYFDEIYEWNTIFYPLEYGVGISRFVVPKIFYPFSKPPEFIGHSGLSGAFNFYNPQKDLFLTGTVNQLHHPDTSFRMMIKIVNCF